MKLFTWVCTCVCRDNFVCRLLPQYTHREGKRDPMYTRNTSLHCTLNDIDLVTPVHNLLHLTTACRYCIVDRYAEFEASSWTFLLSRWFHYRVGIEEWRNLPPRTTATILSTWPGIIGNSNCAIVTAHVSSSVSSFRRETCVFICIVVELGSKNVRGCHRIREESSAKTTRSLCQI